MDLPTMIAPLLAQTAATPTPAPVVMDAAAIALKRWYGSVTLSSPSSLPNRAGLWAWGAGLLGLLVVAIAAQGPKKALGQVLDLRGHLRLFSAAMGRLRRSSRLVAVLLGATVIAWTAWQTPLHSRQEKKEELGILLKSKKVTELASEQGVLAALTPLRDVLTLGDTWILLVGASALIFKFSADRWGRFDDPTHSDREAATGWTTLCWVGSGLYLIYRLAGLVWDADSLQPLGGCLFPEIGVVPGLMALADGVLLAWVLVELRGPREGEDDEGFDVAGTVRLVPASILACLVGMPARYVASALGIAFFHHLPANLATRPWVTFFMRGRGLIDLQGVALLFVGMAGAVAWSGGSPGEAIWGYGRTLRAEGGRLVALLAWGGALAGGLATAAYLAVLSLPAQPWVLSAADSYAHYGSLPVGLVMLAAMVELSGRIPAKSAPGGPREEEAGMQFAETVAARG